MKDYWGKKIHLSILKINFSIKFAQSEVQSSYVNLRTCEDRNQSTITWLKSDKKSRKLKNTHLGIIKLIRLTIKVQMRKEKLH